MSAEESEGQMNVRGLAWDDEPKPYMETLRQRLEPYRIGLEVKHDVGEFWNAYHAQKPEFAVLDLFNEKNDPPTEDGLKIADALPRELPIFVLTAYVDRLRPGLYDFLPPNVALRYKSDEAFIAKLIHDDLKQRGVLINRKQVFLIHRSLPNHEAETLLSRLGEWGIEVVLLHPGGPTSQILTGLLDMNNSGGVIALMSPDEKVEDKAEYRSRPNVLLEIGMAMGLGRGTERLIVLRQDSVPLPTDLGGFLSINYHDSVEESFDQLESRLRYLRLDLSS
jgi:predicted nucleotide-binding protein